MSTLEHTLPPAAASLADTHVAVEMSTGVVSCAPGETVVSVARRMAMYDTHCVVIAGIREAGDHEELSWGLISHEDVVDALIAGRESHEVGELATGTIVMRVAAR